MYRPAAACLALALCACLSDPERKASDGNGYATLRLALSAKPSIALKRTAADPAEAPDSLFLRLTAPGTDPIDTGLYLGGTAIDGQGGIELPTFTLAALRTWSFRIMTVSWSEGARDTLHDDSFSVRIDPADTARVERTLAAKYSILNARIASQVPDSLPKPVGFVRLRVDGETRDSLPVGPTLRDLSFGNNTLGCAVGDSGAILLTKNGGTDWARVLAGISGDLHAVSFPSAKAGYIVGQGGLALKTGTGEAWTRQETGTHLDLHSVFFTGNNAGVAVGDSGLVLRSDGSSWTKAASGTTSDLECVRFTSATVGYAVGKAGCVLKTTDRGRTWSPSRVDPSEDLKAISFPSASIGYLIGRGGGVFKTTNAGGAWTRVWGAPAAALASVLFLSATKGWVAAEDGSLFATSNGKDFNAVPGGGLPGGALGSLPNGKSVFLAGGLGSILASPDGTAWASRHQGSRLFDVVLRYGRVRSGAAHAVMLEALEKASGAVRGYQAASVLRIEAGKDTTVSAPLGLAPCGYAGTAACL